MDFGNAEADLYVFSDVNWTASPEIQLHSVAFPRQPCDEDAVNERLPARTKLAYGLGELGPAMAGSVLVFSQLDFMTNAAGLAAGLAGIVLLISKIWDAVNDPLLGWLSDHTKSRWGRRLPWILGGMIPLGLTFFLMWWVPPFLTGNQMLIFWYFVLIGVIFNTAYTAVQLPHSALTPELSSDYDERSRITGFRMACSLAGSIGGLMVGFGVLAWLSSRSQAVQYAALGGVVGVIIVVAISICLAGIWKAVLKVEERREKIHAHDEPAERIGFVGQLQIVWSNKPFLIVCGIYMFSWLAMQFTATVLPFYIQACLQLPKAEFFKVALIVQCTALAMIPFWGWVSVKLGKKAAYYLAMPVWLIAQGFLLTLQPGQTTAVYILGVMAGVGISVCYLVPNSMLPDTIELDELRTGKRREGVFYGFFVLMQKLILAVSIAVIGFVLQSAGYIASDTEVILDQPASALTAIRIAIGPLPALALAAGILLVIFFPITRKRHAEILAELAARRAAAAGS